jgi:hypothetical protein
MVAFLSRLVGGFFDSRGKMALNMKKLKEEPIVSDRMTLVRKCETCYFCVDAKRVGGSCWCHCSNLARSQDGVSAMSWVRSRLNAPCWQRGESL